MADLIYYVFYGAGAGVCGYLKGAKLPAGMNWGSMRHGMDLWVFLFYLAF